MDEKIENYLYCQHWDQVKSIKKVPVTKFIDTNGGTWDTVTPTAPCGCCPETGENAFRFWLFCPKHPERGILIYGYRENQFFWIPDKVEVKK